MTFSVNEMKDFDQEWAIHKWPLLPDCLAWYRVQAWVAENYSCVTASLQRSSWECILCIYSSYCTFSPETCPRPKVSVIILNSGLWEESVCYIFVSFVSCSLFFSFLFFFKLKRCQSGGRKEYTYHSLTPLITHFKVAFLFGFALWLITASFISELYPKLKWGNISEAAVT